VVNYFLTTYFLHQ